MRRRRRPGCLAAAALAAAGAAVAVAALLPERALRLEGAADARLVRGSVHVHTIRSDGAGTVDDVARAAAAAGLDFVVITDHGDATRPPDPPAYRSGVLCLDAVEISTTGGHYVALGLGRAPYRLAGEPRDVVEDVARLGGFGIAAHPDSPKAELGWNAWDAGIDGVEWLNADSEWRDEPSTALGRAFVTYWLRGPETIAALFDRDGSAFAEWDRLAATRRIVGLAGHDAHARVGLRGNWEPQQGDIALRLPGYESAFRAFAIRARLAAPFARDASADARRLLDAVRAGHVFTVVDAIAGPADLRFEAVGESGRAEAGDELPETGPVRLEARVPSAPGVRLTLVRDGRVVATAAGPRLGYEHPGGLARAVYRVEASLDGRGPDALPWIVGNPIYLGPPPERLVARSVRVSEEKPLGMAAGSGGWVVEREPRSEGRLTADGDGLKFAWQLAGGTPNGQYAAAVRPLEQGQAFGWDQVSFVGSAAGPSRVSVQVREPAGDRWIRSVYLDGTPRPVTVRFDDMRPAERTSPPSPRLQNVDSLLVVVDTVNTAPGGTGWVRLGPVRIERVAPGDQVRTVSSR